MLIATVPYVGKRLHLDPDPEPDPKLITDPDPHMQIISDPSGSKTLLEGITWDTSKEALLGWLESPLLDYDLGTH